VLGLELLHALLQCEHFRGLARSVHARVSVSLTFCLRSSRMSLDFWPSSRSSHVFELFSASRSCSRRVFSNCGP
jgi:hypothetical protein